MSENLRGGFFLTHTVESLGYIFVAVVWVYLHSNFRGGLRKTHRFWNRVRNGPSRSSKVTDFGTNRKRVFIINSTLGPILPSFRDIAGFLLRTTPPLFHPNFRDVPVGLDWRCCGSQERRPKLIKNYSCNLFRTSSTYMLTVPQRYGQTDGQTDARLTTEIQRQRSR